MHSEFYLAYLRSDEWKRIRQLALKAADYRCLRCGASKVPLEVHHLSYENLGRERGEDVEVLCRPCHAQADAQRATASHYRAERRRYDARLNGWASKKYGEAWDYYQDYERVAEEFDEWADRQSDSW